MSRTTRLSEKAQQALDGLHLDAHPDRDALLKRVRGLGQKRRTRILRAALKSHLEGEVRMPFQAELLKLQQSLETDGRKVIVLFEGRDAAGKGGAICRLTRHMNDKHYRVVALGKPTPRQQAEPHMQRYIEHFPKAGEMVLFDRSWYNRAMVEPVMGFCTPEQYEAFMAKVGSYEAGIVGDGKTTLIKLYFSVSRPVQSKRFGMRANDAWKLSEVDRQAQERWESYTEMKAELLRRTHTAMNPWWVIRSDNKKKAQLETMKLILRQIPYSRPSRTLEFKANPDLCVPGDLEYRRMKTQGVV